MNKWFYICIITVCIAGTIPAQNTSIRMKAIGWEELNGIVEDKESDILRNPANLNKLNKVQISSSFENYLTRPVFSILLPKKIKSIIGVGIIAEGYKWDNFDTCHYKYENGGYYNYEDYNYGDSYSGTFIGCLSVSKNIDFGGSYTYGTSYSSYNINNENLYINSDTSVYQWDRNWQVEGKNQGFIIGSIFKINSTNSIELVLNSISSNKNWNSRWKHKYEDSYYTGDWESEHLTNKDIDSSNTNTINTMLVLKKVISPTTTFSVIGCVKKETYKYQDAEETSVAFQEIYNEELFDSSITNRDTTYHNSNDVDVSIGIGEEIKPSPKATIGIGAKWIYETYSSERISHTHRYGIVDSTDFVDSSFSVYNYDDTYWYILGVVGAEYKLIPQFALRGGITFCPYPDIEGLITAGFGYKVFKNFNIDFYIVQGWSDCEWGIQASLKK
ncbi:MAG: hypothetical protein PHE49_00635 [bacterium]|nr:hypothetical protein [bacterium]